MAQATTENSSNPADGLPFPASVIQDVSERIARGIPLDQALAMQDPPLSVEDWAAVESHPYGRVLALRAVGRFHESLILAEISTGRRSLDMLERRFPELWGKPEPVRKVELSGEVKLVAGVTPDVLAKAAEYAKGRD